MPLPIYRLFGARSEGYECLMAMSGIAWAVTLAMPMESFLRFDMRAHAAVAPLWLWAVVAGASGSFHLIGLLARHRRIRLVSCWISMPFWWSVFAIFTADFPASTAPGIYFVHALLGSWACILLSRGRHVHSERL
ncbi:MAG: hypothetical protein OEU92_29940 [Alphaproteobacteria bacterium]|nr:hypothetical protein [Alphaproteobacteria bacterium]